MNTDEGTKRNPETRQRPARIISPFGALVTSLVVSLLVSAAAVKIYHDQFATKIVVIDMRQYVDTLGKQLMEKTMDQPGVEAALRELDRKVQEDMPPGTVVLLNDVVVTNVEQIRP